MAGSKTRHFKYTTDSNGVTISHVDGSSVRTFNIAELSAEMVARLAIHGLKQKLSDDVAAIPTTAAKVTGQAETFAKLKSGVWIERGASDPNGLTRAQVEFAEVAAKVFGKNVDDVKAALIAMEPDSENAAGNTIAGERTLYIRDKSKGKKMAAALADLAVEKARQRAKNLKQAAKLIDELEESL
jgi:hypothetical protein